MCQAELKYYHTALPLVPLLFKLMALKNYSSWVTVFAALSKKKERNKPYTGQHIGSYESVSARIPRRSSTNANVSLTQMSQLKIKLRVFSEGKLGRIDHLQNFCVISHF